MNLKRSPLHLTYTVRFSLFHVLNLNLHLTYTVWFPLFDVLTYNYILFSKSVKNTHLIFTPVFFKMKSGVKKITVTIFVSRTIFFWLLVFIGLVFLYSPSTAICFLTVAKIRFVSKLCLFLNYSVHVSFQWRPGWYVYVRLSRSTAVCACVCASTVCLCGARTWLTVTTSEVEREHCCVCMCVCV